MKQQKETKGNKQILDISTGLSFLLKQYYLTNDLKNINKVLINFLDICKDLNKIPKKYNNFRNFDYLTYTLGNSKIGTDTLCISFNTGLFCCMSLLGRCNNCNICYALSHNKRHFKNTVPKNCINQIVVNKIILNEKELHTVLFNTIQNIYCSLSKKELLNLKFLRVDVEGDILNKDILKVVDKIATVLSSVFDLISSYTYTHNKELAKENTETLTINCSDFKGTKEVRTIYKLNNNILEKILKGDVILCGGDCNNCSYCKNKNENRPIYFLTHGNGLKGVKQIPYWLELIINHYKEVDYNNFLFENSSILCKKTKETEVFI